MSMTVHQLVTVLQKEALTEEKKLEKMEVQQREEQQKQLEMEFLLLEHQLLKLLVLEQGQHVQCVCGVWEIQNTNIGSSSCPIFFSGQEKFGDNVNSQVFPIKLCFFVSNTQLTGT